MAIPSGRITRATANHSYLAYPDHCPPPGHSKGGVLQAKLHLANGIEDPGPVIMHMLLEEIAVIGSTHNNSSNSSPGE